MIQQWPRRDIRDATQRLSAVEAALQASLALILNLEVLGTDARLRDWDATQDPI